MNYLREYNKECRLLAEAQGQIFKKSVEESLPSYFFIKSFMLSEEARLFDNMSLLTSYVSIEDIYLSISKKIKSHRGEVYDTKVIMWIGYFYRTYCYLYNISSNVAFSQISPSYLKRAYKMYHTQDIRKAIDWVIKDLNISFVDDKERIMQILREIR